MELEQFKNLWAEDQGPQQKQDKYLLSLLGKRSNSPIAKMKRNLLRELIAVVILYGMAIIHYFYAFEGRMSEISWLMITIGIIFLVYYYRKNRLLNSMQCVSCHVTSNIELQLGTLEKYVRFYLISGNILFPVTMLVVGYVTIIQYPERVHAPETFPSPAVTAFIVKYISIVFLLSILVFFLNRWYVNKLYGQHITKLREMLKEMKE